MEERDKLPQKEEKEYQPSMFSNVFHSFYERFRGVPLRYFDIFIGLCITAIVVIVVVGVLQARGIL